MEQVLVTGIGVISSLGPDASSFWRALGAASSEPGRARDAYGNYANSLLHHIQDEDEPAGPSALAGIELGRASRLALTAAGQAVADAALAGAAIERAAVIMGTGMGDSDLPERQRVEPSQRSGPTLFTLAAAVAGQFGCTGPATVVSNACAASGYAITLGADMIRAGEADVVIAGGAEAYTRVALASFNRMGAIDPVRCRPFDASRAGTVFGEGAGVLVLESASHARARGATAYGRVAGAGWSCDGYHVTAPEPAGEQIGLAMSRALSQADVACDDVGCIIPHGTGTELNDTVEAHTIRSVFAGHADHVPLYSLKAMIGHTGGAAAAIAAVAGALMIRHRTVPPNQALAGQDPECKVWLPQDAPVPLAPASVLVNAYAFGGLNASVLLDAGDQS